MEYTYGDTTVVFKRNMGNCGMPDTAGLRIQTKRDSVFAEALTGSVVRIGFEFASVEIDFRDSDNPRAYVTIDPPWADAIHVTLRD